MSLLPYIPAVVFLLLAAWFAWRYFDLRHKVNQLSQSLRDEKIVLSHSNEIDELVSVLESRRSVFTADLTGLRAENERLATVLEQLTDGVLIADADGRVEFANPAAGEFFGTDNPAGKSVAQVLRSHQLI